jgi:excisionase family DNA binding protein
MDDKRLLTVDEAAQRLGIGRSHAYVYVLRGELESVKLGRSRRVPAEAIDEYVKKLRAESDLETL